MTLHVEIKDPANQVFKLLARETSFGTMLDVKLPYIDKETIVDISKFPKTLYVPHEMSIEKNSKGYFVVVDGKKDKWADTVDFTWMYVETPEEPKEPEPAQYEPKYNILEKAKKLWYATIDAFKENK